MDTEKARYWLACEARHLEICARIGANPLVQAGKQMTEEEIKAWSLTTAWAIRVILRAAGLSEDVHIQAYHEE